MSDEKEIEIQDPDFNDVIGDEYEGFEILEGDTDKVIQEGSDDKEEDTSEEKADEVIEATEEKTTEETSDLGTIDTSWFDQFNEQAGGKYSSVDEVKSILDEYHVLKEKVDSIASNDAQTGLSEEQVTKLKEYIEKVKPESFFANDVELKKNLLMKANPNVNGEVAGKVFNIDFKSANPLDVIALNMALKHSSIEDGEVGALEIVLEDYGISSKEDLEDLTRVQKNKIKIAAEEAAMEITKLRDSIQSPDVTDVESLLSELNLTSVKQEQQYDMSAWEGKIDKVIDMTKEFALKEGDSVLYSEPIAKEFFDDAKEVIESAIKQGRLEPTEENIKIMSEELRKAWVAEHGEEVMKRMLKAQERKLREQYHKEIHNDTDPDKSVQRPKINTKNTSDSDMRRILGIRV